MGLKPVVVVDLFCGMGGFTQGAIDAGAEVILAVDSWNEACKVHDANYPDTRIDCVQLGNPDWYKGLLRFLEPYRENYHIHLHGSPPCQALSNASTRSPEEGMPLVIWFLNLVKSAQPDSWSMENVVPVRKRLPEGTPSVTLNSADFGVPQTRRRCYAGTGWEAEPTHAKEEWVSVIEALPHIAEELPPKENVNRLVLPIQRKVGWMNISGRKKPRYLHPIWREVDEPMNTITTQTTHLGYLENFTHNVGGSTESIGEAAENRDRVITKPSKVIRAHTTTLRDRREWDKPKKIRSLTIEETLVLQGFSPDYNLSSAKTKKSQWTMVGNAVPPPVAEAVIRGIQNAD